MREIILNHPLITHKVTILKNKDTGTKEFREIINEISMMLCYEAMKDVSLEECEVETPLTKTKGYLLNENKYAFVPILRAGTGMIDGITKVVPNAKIGHIGLYRDPDTLKPVEYYCKVPKNLEKREIFLLDPMLATGGSADAAIVRLKELGAKKIKFLCILAAPEGLSLLAKNHPDVQIYCAKVDDYLNDHGYIVPGLGDAGDRIFGTK